MAVYDPPTENLPIFDNSVFLHTEAIDLPYLNKHYLRYPTAQGTENFGDIVVNGNGEFHDDVNVDGNITLTTIGKYLQFPDGTQQTTAFTGTVTGTTYSVSYYTDTPTITIPVGCRKIDVLVVGRGGDCGDPYTGVPYGYGGSGSGGNSTWANGIPMYEGDVLALTLSTTNSSGSTTLTRYGTVLARAYNGNKGAASGTGGQGGTSNTAHPGEGDSSFGTWTFAYGTIGGNGTSTPPTMNPIGAQGYGCPKGVRGWDILKYGTAQRALASAPSGGGDQLSGYCMITFYITT